MSFIQPAPDVVNLKPSIVVVVVFVVTFKFDLMFLVPYVVWTNISRKAMKIKYD